MNKRPRSVTVISVLFIAFGGVALLRDLLPRVDVVAAQFIAEMKGQHTLEYVFILPTHALAVVSGVFMLRGFNWARCLLIVWVGSHVIIGFLHSPVAGLVHGMLFSVVVYFLFRPRASVYFLGSRAGPPQNQKTNDTPVI